MELCPYAVAVLKWCLLQVLRMGAFRESSLAPGKAGIVNPKLWTVLGIGKKISLPEQRSSVLRHLVSNLENILIVLIFFHDKIQAAASREGKKSQIILITG